MARYRLKHVGAVARKLGTQPEAQRKAVLRRVEDFVRQLDPSDSYALSSLYQEVLQLPPPEDVAELFVEGQTLLGDLCILIHELSASLSIPVSTAPGAVLTVEQVKEMYDVSESTISRWRGEGLICKRYVFANGRRRTGILEHDLRAFMEANANRIHKTLQVEPLSEAAKQDLAMRARQYVARERWGLSQVASRLALEYNLPHEMVLYALKRYDEEHPDRAIFPDALSPLTEECKREIYRAYNAGESIDSICRRYRRARSTIYRIVRESKAMAILNAKTELIYNPIFDDPNADAIILGQESTPVEVPLSPEYDEPLPGAPEQPQYLKEAARTPLLSREEEVELFRRYNYIKYKLARLKKDLKPSDLTNDKLQMIVQLQNMADAVKNRIIESNLRLVISIAKKHITPFSSFNELVSDGNVSLMRAVEKFDYSRGIRFSTYASWAIMKNFAKTIPEQTSAQDRFATGTQELLEVVPDSRENLRRRGELLMMLKHVVNELLDELTEREKDIIISRYGLKDGQPHTLEQVGEEFNVTRERVRQIEHRALRKLRQALQDKHIEDFE